MGATCILRPDNGKVSEFDKLVATKGYKQQSWTSRRMRDGAQATPGRAMLEQSAEDDEKLAQEGGAGPDNPTAKTTQQGPKGAG